MFNNSVIVFHCSSDSWGPLIPRWGFSKFPLHLQTHLSSEGGLTRIRDLSEIGLSGIPSSIAIPFLWIILRCNIWNMLVLQYFISLKPKRTEKIGLEREIMKTFFKVKAWPAAIHGVAKSRTWLSDWTELNWNPWIWKQTNTEWGVKRGREAVPRKCFSWRNHRIITHYGAFPSP